MNETKVTLSFDAPTDRAADLAKAVRDIVRAQGCTPGETVYDPPLPEYAPGISAEEAAHRRIHGPPLTQGPLV